MKNLLSTLILSAALASASPAPVPALHGIVPDPTKIHINAVTYGGTGCPQGTVGVAISADRSIVTLIFDAYVASIGPGVSVTENRKNCQINLHLLYPPGIQFSVFSADYRGYAALEAGINGELKSNYYFSGQTEQSSVTAKFTGPVSGDYLKHDEAISTTTVWSPCGQEGLLNINSQVRMTSTNTKRSGLLTTDSVDAKFTQTMYFNWQTCTKS